jgi:subtilisin family serine protease
MKRLVTRVRRGRRLLALVLAPLLAAGVAGAQVSLPDVKLPDLPVDLPVDANDPLPVAERLELRELRNQRLLRVRQLLRQNRQVLETDPRGAPILRGQILAFGPGEAAIESARQQGFRIIRERALEGLGTRIVVLAVPEKMSTRRALKKLKELDAQGTYDFNHVYTDSGEVGTAPARAPTPALREANIPEPPTQAFQTRIGLIDGGVDASHVVFSQGRIHARGCDGKPVVSAHGTAVASLMVGVSPQLRGAAQGAALYAADVYCGVPVGGSVEAIVEAFAWMASERVPTINVSLVGPPNVLLEHTVRTLIQRGHVVVAAVGNDGPSAAPLYPASYPDVIGVTGVDAKRKALLEAGRGPQVDFAAPGADMAAAGINNGFAGVRGTSFAAPIVAGLLASRLADVEPGQRAEALTALTRAAVDLGSRGPDRVYGAGLVGEDVRAVPPAAARPSGKSKN